MSMSTMSVKAFSYRLGNLEARVTDRMLLSPSDDKPVTVDIVQWVDTYCFSIAYFVEIDEGSWDLKFVGARPLDAKVNWQDFRHMIEMGLAYLTELRGSGGACDDDD